MSATLRALPHSRLDNLLPALLQSQALVALVAVTGDLRWAAKTAWDVARIAAKDGRRVALVDLWVDEPVLHDVKGLPPAGGVVDVFERGEDLTAAAQQVGDVFFIAAGSSTAAPEFLLAHPRWKKLQAGFRSEDALLLLFLSGPALAKLSAVPDGVILLAPEGVDLASPGSRGIVAAQQAGVPLLGVVRERWTPPPMRIPLEAAEPPRRSRLTLALGLVAVAVAGLGGWSLLATAHESPEPPVAVTTPDSIVTAATSSQPPAPVPTPTRDTMPWTIQLAAYGSVAKALAQADRLASDDVPAVVTPVTLAGSGTIWYRVLAGAYPTRDSAVAARARLWSSGATQRGEGDLLRAPYTFALAPDLDLAELRRRGLPAIRLPDWPRPFVGAFETPEQAALTRTLLTRAGLQAPLIARTEITP